MGLIWEKPHSLSAAGRGKGEDLIPLPTGPGPDRGWVRQAITPVRRWRSGERILQEW